MVKFSSFLRSFWVDAQGVTWLYITVASAALFGFAALVIDFTRVEVTHTQARAAAEAAALAGASQLDGLADSITRATNAAQTTPLVQNTQKLGATPGNITITGIRFLSGIPAGDPTLPRNPSALDSFVLDPTNADAPFEARFIEVTTQQITVNNSFIQILGGGGTAVTTSSAVAGFTQVLCRRAPLAICNPVENPANSYGTPAPAFNIADWKGRQILIKGAGPSSDWVPGDFALVDVAGLQSTPAIWEALAESEPDVCISARIDLKPGQVQGARNALNTRFGMYKDPFGGNKGGNSRFRPARSVAKGMVLSDPTDQCSFVEAASMGAQGVSMALPKDTDAANYAGALNGTGPTNTHRFGTGTWNCLAYMTAMHPSVTRPTWCTATTDGKVAGRSRYDMYRAEIDGTAPFAAQSIPDQSAATPIAGENANPVNGSCYTGGSGTLNDTPDRRIVYFAVINCVELGPLRGNSNGDLPVEAFVEAFLTEPVDDPSDGPEIFLEIKDIVRPNNSDGILHDIVQLYR
jgi:hypothetical protein